MAEETVMEGVRDYYEGGTPVYLGQHMARWFVSNNGWEPAHIDLCDLIAWLREKRPDILETALAAPYHEPERELTKG